MTSPASTHLTKPCFRLALLVSGLGVLGLVYIFQDASPAALIGIKDPNTVFAVNRSARLILNDFACLLIILAIFRRADYLRLALYVFLMELFLMLPAYLAVKLTLEGDSEISSPLLSHIHRLIVNPMLMILLIAGFFYQRVRTPLSRTLRR